MRQIVLDTETTGLEVSQGHRIIEIGCIEMNSRRVTDRHWHHYVNPEREVDIGAFEVHGISNDFLKDKPRFADVAQEFLDFIDGAELVIHNAAFDIGFLNKELQLLGEEKELRIENFSTVLDTLKMARQKHPGQKNNLDALCKRYFIDNSHRSVHGALLDARILADVYLAMTGGQTSLGLDSSSTGQSSEQSENLPGVKVNGPLPVWTVGDDDEAANRAYIAFLSEQCENPAWK